MKYYIIAGEASGDLHGSNLMMAIKKLDANAVKFDEISYADVLTKDLKVMDQTAITLCKDNNIDLCVFNMQEDGNIAKACDGQKIGTTISGGK